MEVVPEPVKRIDSGLHIGLRRELNQKFFRGSLLQGRYNTIQHPVNVVLFLLGVATFSSLLDGKTVDRN